MIDLSHIQFSYPRSDFSLEIQKLQFSKGSKTAIIGPSGFGKTTLLNLLAGIFLPRTGEITVNGKTLTRASEKERRNFRIRNIGFVFQDFRLIPYLNVLDNILLPFRINRLMTLDNTSRQSASRLATALGLDPKLLKFPARLSHGERQRVAICRALVNSPPVILADEPTGNLDPGNKEKIMDILFSYVEEHQATLITVTHDMHMLDGFNKTVDFADLQKLKA
jgi:putative ABC transport system ATP-binding protein